MLGCFGLLTLTGGAILLKHMIGIGYTDARSNIKIKRRNDLPFYRMEEVRKHGKDAKSIWVTFQGVSNFSMIHINISYL